MVGGSRTQNKQLTICVGSVLWQMTKIATLACGARHGLAKIVTFMLAQ
jgi:hypothetical protein